MPMKREAVFVGSLDVVHSCCFHVSVPVYRLCEAESRLS